ncbi:MAG: glycosyl hydrolase, partial [Bacteroidota bacterium]|nr:glycosyl hydrolase [Bacteroidota bacterium]
MKNYLLCPQRILMIITFILAVNITASFSQARVQDDTVKALQAAIPPVINGVGDDDCWQKTKWQPIGQAWIPYGETVDPGDYSGKYKVSWSAAENLLYFLVEITDDEFVDGYVYDSIPGIGGGYYNDDILEVFLDENKSGGLHIYDDGESAFSYHIVINAPGDGNTTDQYVVCDIAGSGGTDYWFPNYAGHFPQFAVKKTGNQYVWEFSLAVYNDTYNHNNPEVSRVQLQEGKVMGLSLAYCDNDDPDENPKKRDNFFGSVWVPESANNDHWKDADGYGTIMLISDVTCIEKGFINPPLYARPRVFWWWLNSMVTKESITHDLEELKDKGFGGAILFDAASYEYIVVNQTPAGPVFASEEWKELFVHALKVADKLGLEISLNIQSGWNPGGPSVLPDDGLKKVVWVEEKVTGPIKYTKTLPIAAGHYYKDIVVQAYKIQEGKQQDPIKNWGYKSLNEQFRGRGAYPLYKLREQLSDTADAADLQSDSIIDLSAKMDKDGFLSWDVPEGTWVILRFGSILTKAQVSTCSAGWQGLSFDHLNSEALENYFSAVVDPLLESAGDLVG